MNRTVLDTSNGVIALQKFVIRGEQVLAQRFLGVATSSPPEIPIVDHSCCLHDLIIWSVVC